MQASMSKQFTVPDVIGLIPAAGQATRIAPLPGSKELYPIGFDRRPDHSLRPKVVSHYLLETMHRAGIETAYLILRAGKWDIPAYFGDGTIVQMHLGYLMMGLPFGVPYTLDQAYPFVRHSRIALGFPDILFQPQDAFKHLLSQQTVTQADVVLGVVPFNQPQHSGMVGFDAQGRVYQVLEKPSVCDLQHSWFIATWAPSFTEFMHQYLMRLQSNELHQIDPAQPQELSMSEVIQAAIAGGLSVVAECFPDGQYLDIGRPNTLIQAVHQFAEQALSSDHIGKPSY
jgi:glucose-1-phosphate thymidylyltransferase